MSSDPKPNATFGASRFDAYSGPSPDFYKRGYFEAGRFQPDQTWPDDDRAAYRQGVTDRYADSRAEDPTPAVSGQE